MDYLSLNRKSLAWRMVQDPVVLLTTFDQWVAYVEDGDPKKYVFWSFVCDMTADRIETAIQLAKSFSTDIARYCDDASHGRAPGFKEAIRCRQVGEPDASFDFWKSQVSEYSEFFADALEFNRVVRSLEQSKQQEAFASSVDVNASQEVFEALQTIYKNAPGATRNAMLKEYRSRMKEKNGPGIKQTIGLAMLRKIAGEKKK